MAEAKPPDGDDDGDLRRPASLGQLGWVFNRLALQGFGGVLPVAHRELVDRERWVSPAQFVELLTLGQALPGPNIINIAIILGDRFFGWRGALVAVLGLLGLPLVIVLGLAMVYQQFAANPLVAGALRGMGAVAAGLVIATAVKLARTLRHNPLGMTACAVLGAAAAALVGGLRWPMVGVVLGLGLWRAAGPGSQRPVGSPAASAHAALPWRHHFRQGFLTNALNPKVALFFLAFVPQFIRTDAAHQAQAFVLLGTVFVVNSTLVNLGLAGLVAGLRRPLGRKASWVGLGRWLNRGVGALFIGLGLRLAWGDGRA